MRMIAGIGLAAGLAGAIAVWFRMVIRDYKTRCKGGES